MSEKFDTDKVYAESIANKYSIKNDSKVVALKNLIKRLPFQLQN